MCRFKSGIILKDRVFIPEYDSHQKMLDELGIEDNRQNAEKLFIRAELVPRDGNVLSDINNWVFIVDQDILPDWYVKDYDKQRMVEAVKEWAKNHIHIGVDNLEITSGEGHYIKDCKDVVIYGNAIVERICGSATVEYICDNATVKYICGSATVKYIYDNATVENISDNATVKTAKGQSTIITSPYSEFKNKDKLILLENATLKDCYHKVIYQSGVFKFVSVSDTGKLEGS